MKVLFADQFSDLGGAQQCLVDAVRAALERGWSSAAVLPGEGPLAETLRGIGVDLTMMRCGPYQRGTKTVLDLVRYSADQISQRATFSRLLEAAGCDLLYVNGPRVLPAAVRAARGRVPVVFHAHSRPAQWYAVPLVGRSIRNGGVTVVACSRFVAEPLTPYVSPGRLHVISNGVAGLPFRTRAFERTRPWRIGIAGRIAPEKGHITFVEAANAALPHLPRGTTFVICGSPATSGDSYFAHVRRAAAGHHFAFLPWQDDIGRVFDDLDLLIVPSVSEGMPRVILEAFSAGVPVLAFPAGGITEVIRDGETGFLVHDSSARQLAERTVELVAGDPLTLQSVCTRARALWEREHNVRIWRERITALMEQTARLPGRGTGTARRQAHTA